MSSACAFCRFQWGGIDDDEDHHHHDDDDDGKSHEKEASVFRTVRAELVDTVARS